MCVCVSMSVSSFWITQNICSILCWKRSTLLQHTTQTHHRSFFSLYSRRFFFRHPRSQFTSVYTIRSKEIVPVFTVLNIFFLSVCLNLATYFFRQLLMLSMLIVDFERRQIETIHISRRAHTHTHRHICYWLPANVVVSVCAVCVNIMNNSNQIGPFVRYKFPRTFFSSPFNRVHIHKNTDNNKGEIRWVENIMKTQNQNRIHAWSIFKYVF